MAASLEAALAQGVKDGKIPHAIVCATNKDGSFEYHHATGFQNYGVNDEPIQEDAVLMLASQTKLLTSIAALKVVEQSLIGLDEDVCPHLPELAAHKIIQGFDEDDKPKLVERKGPITIRHLLTHTSGTTYVFPGTDAMKYDVQRGRKHPDVSLAPTIAERCDTTLIFEPGTSWMYSPGPDWVGLLIQRLSKLSLDEYMQQHLFKPLGITGITFWPAQREHLKDKIAGLVVRTPEGKLVPNTDPTINTGTTDCFGGHGAYAKMGDYLKVMRSLLANDGKLLTPASVDMLFEPQLGDDSKAAANGFIKAFSAGLPGEFEDDVPVDHGLGGLLFLKDGDGRRKKGTLGWGGYFNPFWIIDREANIAFTMGLQAVPPGDPGCKEMTGVAERAIYKMAGIY